MGTVAQKLKMRAWLGWRFFGALLGFCCALCASCFLKPDGPGHDDPSPTPSGTPWPSFSPQPGAITSLEFGHRESPAKDYCAPIELGEDFGAGILISFWTKITYPIVPPDFRGNQNICRIYGDNWDLICLDGNIGTHANAAARYNANYMFNYDDRWGSDLCTYYSLEDEGLSMEEANGWVWVAWQVVINQDRSMTFRQWLKFGMEGAVIPAGHWSVRYSNPGEETLAPGSMALDPINTSPIPTDFNPSPPRRVQVGDDNTYSASGYDTHEPLTPSNSWICHGRIDARADKPSIDELDEIARGRASPYPAWADWELAWKGDAPDLSDRSGHGRDLSLMPGGALSAGGESPTFE